MTTSEQDLRRIAADAASQAASHTIRETFRLMGVDVSDQDSVNEFRADLVHARRLRRLNEKVGGTVIVAIVGTIAVVGGSWIWDGLKSSIIKVP